MNEKDLLEQLNKFKGIKPDQNWKEKNREILLKQVFNAEVENENFAGFDWIKGFAGSLRPHFLSNVHYSSVAVVLVLVFVMGGGVFSLKAAQNTKPGDSLYLAKIATEKTQLALTIGEKNKVRLGITFAGNRAEEIDKVLSENNDNNSNTLNEENREKVEKLVSDFKKEIDSVKTRLAKIGSKDNEETAADPVEVVEEPETSVAVQDKDAEDDAQVFSANLGKDESGIQISDSVSGGKDAAQNDDTEEVSGVSMEKEAKISTSSDEALDMNAGNPQSILKQAEELLNIEDYDATLNKLDEAGEMIVQLGIGQVKGDEDKASSSDGVLGDDESEKASSTTNE